MIRGANGILFWGYCWDQENHRPWGNRDPVDPAWQGQVDEYCRKLGINLAGKWAGWHLASKW